MDIRIETKPGFKVAGIKAEGITSSDCPGIWDQLYGRHDHTELTQLGSGQSYGVCYGLGGENRISYMTAYDLKDEQKVNELGLDIMEVPAAEYAIYQVTGSVPESIHKGLDYLSTYLPELGYRHTGQPEFEVYGEGDISQSDYQMTLWIPVEKA